MTDYAIQVQGLGKKFRIGSHAPYHRFTELLANAAAAPFRIASRRLSKAGQPGQAAPDAPNSHPEKEFWALRDVNFEIKQGEIVGIIGRNGAGKSTLLKLLSRITLPTTGRIRYRGRIGSLLEVGTGFHPELTGRDNIYLNGAILGMTRAEVRRKFDEIVAFAEVERFLDTTVKHYSSGMYMRLAFAVAAHLETEILLVDEVLAVGDAEFQKKCLGKMGEVAKGGKTVLFVSHSMGAIRSLCSHSLLLERGKVQAMGPTGQVIDKYLQQPPKVIDVKSRMDRQGGGRIRITDIQVVTADGNSVICAGDDVRIIMDYEVEGDLPFNVQVILGVYDYYDAAISRIDTSYSIGDLAINQPKGRIECKAGPFNITPGPLYLNMAILVGGTIEDYVSHIADIVIESSVFYPTGKMFERKEAIIIFHEEWSISPNAKPGNAT